MDISHPFIMQKQTLQPYVEKTFPFMGDTATATASYVMRRFPWVEKILPFKDVAAAVGPYRDTAATIASYIVTPFSWLKSGYNCLYGQLSKPEPPSAPGHFLLGSLPELASYKWDIFNFLKAYESAFGQEGICKLKLGTKIFYIVSDAKIASEILSKPKSFIRGQSLRIWRKFSAEGLSEGPHTEKLRLKAQNAIGEGHYEYFFPTISRISSLWIEKLKRSALKKEPIDIMRECELVGLAALGEALFKHNSWDVNELNPFNLSQENEPLCIEFLDSIHMLFTLITKRIPSAVANFPLVGDWLYDHIHSDEKEAFDNAKASIEKILLRLFKDLLKDPQNIDSNSDFYRLIVQTFGVDIYNPDYQLMLDESMGFLQAAFETTSKAIGWALYSLAAHPSIQEELRSELQKAFGSTSPKCMEDLKKVPRLFQVIEETLRLYPPFPFLLRDIKDAAKFVEYSVKNEATFILAPYFVHRTWEDGSSFNPDRFTEEMLTDKWQRNHPEYLMFLGGIHRCPGRFFAKQELALILTSLLLHFKVSYTSNIPPALKFCITLQPKSPIYLNLEPV